MSSNCIDYRNLTDEKLIEEFRRGRSEVMDYLLDKYKPMVRKKANALYLIGGDTEDLIQEGMIGLFQAVRDFDPEKNSSFSAFAALCINRHIFSVLEASGRKKNQPLNTAVSFSTEVNTEGELLEETLGSENDNPEFQILEQEKLQELWRQLENSLSSMEKQVLNLHLAGNNYVRIAEIMKKPPKSIDNCLQRIRRKMRQLQEMNG